MYMGATGGKKEETHKVEDVNIREYLLLSRKQP